MTEQVAGAEFMWDNRWVAQVVRKPATARSNSSSAAFCFRAALGGAQAWHDSPSRRESLKNTSTIRATIWDGPGGQPAFFKIFSSALLT